MNSQTSLKAKDDAIEWALTHGMAFKQSPYSARHAPFTLTPSLISRTHYQYLKNSVHLLGKLIHYLSEEHAFLIDAIQPITVSEPFLPPCSICINNSMILSPQYRECRC